MKNEKFIAVVVRADVYSGVSEAAYELEDLNVLGSKYPDFPFSLFFTFDVTSNEYGNKTQSRIDRRMREVFRNQTALMITIVLEREKFPKETLSKGSYDRSKLTPPENIAHARKIMEKELIEILPIALKKQEKNFPLLAEYSATFIADFEMEFAKLGWGGSRD
ncbi:hypothetical protein [Enterococcus sp. BWR-S5]|uniref:hypothetical protein n=1 Tax=Enterococcus sp. BWR-S5 TaxID=2787714 RepID=UPI001922EBCE|nr:hypothetical protein [Enterococcus sp. BWR-S5]MBL1226673.1 hypothetical protein [Enterococcus sp. BWR-S5]